MDRCLELLDSEHMQTPLGRRILFSNPEYNSLLLINYQQYKKLFQIDEELLPKINKMIIYGELDYYNYVQNQVWAYKWYPLLFKFAINSLRFQSTSIIFSLLYLTSVEVLSERFCMFQYLDQNIIDVGKIFTLALSKDNYLLKQNQLFQNYKAVVKQNCAQNIVKQDSNSNAEIILGQKFNIYNPYLNWTVETEQSKNELKKNLFIQNNQIPLLFERIKKLGQWLLTSNSTTLQIDINQQYTNLKHHMFRIKEEFPVYKYYLHQLPTYWKIKDNLEYHAIDQRKLYFTKDEFKYQLSKVVNTLFDMISIYSKLIGPPKDPHIVYLSNYQEIENFMYDFATFTVLCLLPSKVLGYRNSIAQFRKMSKIARSLSG